MIPSITIGITFIMLIGITEEIKNYKERKRKKRIWEMFSGQTV